MTSHPRRSDPARARSDGSTLDTYQPRPVRSPVRAAPRPVAQPSRPARAPRRCSGARASRRGCGDRGDSTSTSCATPTRPTSSMTAGPKPTSSTTWGGASASVGRWPAAARGRVPMIARGPSSPPEPPGAHDAGQACRSWIRGPARGARRVRRSIRPSAPAITLGGRMSPGPGAPHLRARAWCPAPRPPLLPSRPVRPR